MHSSRGVKGTPETTPHHKNQNSSKSHKNKKSQHNSNKAHSTLPPNLYRASSLKTSVTQIEGDSVPVPPLTVSKSTPGRQPNLGNGKTKPHNPVFNLHSLRNISNEYPLYCSSTSSIKDCLAIQRIIHALKYYESLDIVAENNPSHISTFIANIMSIYTVKRLLDDFIHIQSIHSRDMGSLSSFMISKVSN
eukprot:114642_1